MDQQIIYLIIIGAGVVVCAVAAAAFAKQDDGLHNRGALLFGIMAIALIIIMFVYANDISTDNETLVEQPSTTTVMEEECFECGEVVEGNFCSNCGAPTS